MNTFIFMDSSTNHLLNTHNPPGNLSAQTSGTAADSASPYSPPNDTDPASNPQKSQFSGHPQKADSAHTHTSPLTVGLGTPWPL